MPGNWLLDFGKEEEKSYYGGNSHPMLGHNGIVEMILFFIMSNIHQHIARDHRLRVVRQLWMEV
jgi:hypothetical protein